MTIKNILYIDDKMENGLTAMSVDPRIDFVSSAKLIKRPLRNYDCIITDMQMEHAKSGMELVERALREGRLPYVATGGTYEHGGTFNRVRLFDSGLVTVFDKTSKNDEKFWRGALAFIERYENRPEQIALNHVWDLLGKIPEDTIKIGMHFYKKNHKSII